MELSLSGLFKKMILRNMSVKAKLLTLAGVSSIGLLILGGSEIVALRTIQAESEHLGAVEEFRDLNRQIDSAMLQARRSEKVFLMRKDPKYVGRVAGNVDSIRAYTDYIVELDISEELNREVETMNALISAFKVA